MQHTCNTHATHMQHEHFPCKFPSKVAAGAKIYTFHSKTGVGAANVKSCTLTVNLQVKSSFCMSCCMSCCMCVACVLHVRCTAGVQDRAVTLSKWRACHAERQPVHPTTLRNQVCMGLPLQRTCNTHATHMQHTCNTSIFPVSFQAKWPRGQKSTLSILRPELGLQTSNPARWL